jgi:hypothetical protein
MHTLPPRVLLFGALSLSPALNNWNASDITGCGVLYCFAKVKLEARLNYTLDADNTTLPFSHDGCRTLVTNYICPITSDVHLSDEHVAY